MLLEIRLALRSLLRQRGFTALAAASLALGIGLFATQFGIIDGVLLRGLPTPEPQNIIHVARLSRHMPERGFWEGVPYRDFLALRERQTVFATLTGIQWMGLNLSGSGRLPSQHPGGQVTHDIPALLGVQPLLGRWFTAEEDKPGQPLRVVLSHALWQEEFAGDRAVIGQPLTVNGESATIVGVMPPRFGFPGSEKLWTNLRAAPGDPRERPFDRLQLVGRLRPGVTLDEARTQINAIAADLERQWPDTNHGFGRMTVEKFAYAVSGSDTRRILFLMLTMAGSILALACVNVANMLLGRSARRARELAVRAAVGASPRRIARLLFLEAFLLAGLGAAGGLLLAATAIDLLQNSLAVTGFFPGWFEFRLDGRIVGVAILATMTAGVLAGVYPAFRAARVDVNSALKDASPGASFLGRGRVNRWLVTLQIAFSSALLVCAGLLGSTIQKMRSANDRWDPAQLLNGRIELHDTTHPTPEHRARFYRELIRRLEAEPGVAAVAVTSRNLAFSGVDAQLTPEGAVFAHENDRPHASLEVVSSAYFQLVRTGALAGRLFDRREEAPGAGLVAVVNEPFAKRFWPGQDPLGQRFTTNRTGDAKITVIGVVPDLNMNGLFAPADADRAGFYLSQDQMGWGWLDLFIRTNSDPLALVPSVRRAIAALDPNQPIHSVATLEGRTRQLMTSFNFIGVMSVTFAAIALLLGAVGVYGVTTLAVGHRTREFGVRFALGATAAQVRALVLVQSGRQIALGLLLGTAGGFLLIRPLENVFGTRVTGHTGVYLVVAAIISAAGLLALWLPARRAARTDPIVALRAE
jgi:putative ABC transport system permease protein